MAFPQKVLSSQNAFIKYFHLLTRFLGQALTFFRRPLDPAFLGATIKFSLEEGFGGAKGGWLTPTPMPSASSKSTPFLDAKTVYSQTSHPSVRPSPFWMDEFCQ